MDDAGSGGAVSRLCDAVQSALDHRARRTLGRRVSDALGLDRLRTPAAIDAREATFAHRNTPRETQKNGASPNPVTTLESTSPAPDRRRASSAAAALEAFERRCVDRSRSMAREMCVATTPAGRARAWIHGGLNRGDLAERTRGARRDETHRARRKGGYYDVGALLADETAAARVVGALREDWPRYPSRSPQETRATPSRDGDGNVRRALVGGFIPGAPSASPSAAVRTSAAALLRFRARLRADARWGASASARLEAIAPPSAIAILEGSEREENQEKEEEGGGGRERRGKGGRDRGKEEKEEDSEASPTETTKSTHANGASSSTTSIEDAIASYAAANAIVTDALEAVDEAEAASPAIVPATGVPSGVKSDTRP